MSVDSELVKEEEGFDEESITKDELDEHNKGCVSFR